MSRAPRPFPFRHIAVYAGADRSVYDAQGWGADQISDFSRAEGDRLDFRGSGVTSISALNISSAANTFIQHAGGSIYLYGVTTLSASDFIFS